jgi:hypothetical protein
MSVPVSTAEAAKRARTAEIKQKEKLAILCRCILCQNVKVEIIKAKN